MGQLSQFASCLRKAQSGVSLGAALAFCLLSTPAEVFAKGESVAPGDAAAPPLTVSWHFCPDLLATDAFLELLRLELTGRAVAIQPMTTDASAPAAPFVALEQPLCATNEVSIRLGRQETLGAISELRTQLDLGDVQPADRARTLAIAVAELIRTLLPEDSQSSPPSPPTLPLTQTTPPPGNPPPLQPEPRPLIAEAPPPWSLAAQFGLGLRASGTSPWLGGGLALHYQPSSTWRPWLSLVTEHSDARAQERLLDLWIFATRLGLDAQLPMGTSRLFLGAAFEAGLVRAQGLSPQAGPEEPVLGVTLAPLIHATLETPITRHWAAFAALEAGLYVRELRLLAQGQPAVAFAGFTGSGKLGVAVAF